MTTPSVTAPRPRESLVHDIPLGNGHLVRLVLPRDMTTTEADRLCGIIQALAFGEELP